MSWHVVTARALWVFIVVCIALIVGKEVREHFWWKRYIETARVKRDYK